MRNACIMLLAVVMATSGRVGAAAERGDVDGDGRVTLGDVRFYMKYCLGDPSLAAPGSLEGLIDLCHGGEYPSSDDVFRYSSVPLLIYLESLSRGVPGALPLWRGVPAASGLDEPLPADPRVVVDVSPEPAAGGDADRVVVKIRLTNLAPVESFSLVFETDGGVLQVGEASPGWYFGTWWQLPLAMESHWKADPVCLSAAAYLATGGKYVVTYRLWARRDVIAPGMWEFPTTGRLAVGTEAGTYAMRLAPGSHVVLEDGTVIAPKPGVEDPIVVEEDVAVGWDDGPPPLLLDPASRLVLGKVEFRLVDGDGNEPTPGEPIATVVPGESLTLRVQLRTEVPLNFVSYTVSWPPGALECSGRQGSNRFVNPEDGTWYPPSEGGFSDGCADVPFPNFGRRYELAGSAASQPTSYPGRILEYFRPLGAWTDLDEILLRVPESAPLGDATFQLGSLLGSIAEYVPYGKRGWSVECPESPAGKDWEYDIEFHEAKVRIVSEDPPPPPPPPPDYGIEVVVGDAVGAPGDLVEVPVWVRADWNLNYLRLVVAPDPANLEIEKVEVDIESRVTSELVPFEIGRGEIARLKEDCTGEEPPVCTYGIPDAVRFEETLEDDLASIWVSPQGGGESGFVEYPGPDLREAFRLLVRIREDAPSARAAIGSATATLRQGDFTYTVRSGGYAAFTTVFGPAKAFEPGTVFITQGEFLRGDSNVDGTVDLSDAVAILGYLFLGGEDLRCLDGADSDDNGSVEITDAILILGVLFLGQGDIPAPYPDCGLDPTDDDLGCGATTCR